MADVNSYRDEAARVMGQYLLKGYKMLANHCPTCGTVMIQKAGDKEKCVLCHEILQKVPDSVEMASETVVSKESYGEATNNVCSGHVNASTETIKRAAVSQQLDATRLILLAQITQAGKELEVTDESSSVLTRTQLCSLITTAATALKNLKDCENSLI